jgi:hypothetical protein
MGRNFLGHAIGDAANEVLAAAGYNIRCLLAWLRILRAVFVSSYQPIAPPNGGLERILHGRQRPNSAKQAPETRPT